MTDNTAKKSKKEKANDKASKDAADNETTKLVSEFTNTITYYNKYITQIKSDYSQKNISTEAHILKILKKIMIKLNIE